MFVSHVHACVVRLRTKVAGWNKPNMLGNLKGLIKKMRNRKTIPKRPKNPMAMVQMRVHACMLAHAHLNSWQVNKDAFGKRRGLVGRIAKMAGASKVAGLSAMAGAASTVGGLPQAGGATTNKGKIPKMPEGSGVKGTCMHTCTHAAAVLACNPTTSPPLNQGPHPKPTHLS